MSTQPSVVRRCPRCGYRGEGITHFSRGPHLALLIFLAVLTAWALGAAALLYYLFRREHLACPRCGQGWGRFGRESLPAGPDPARDEAPREQEEPEVAEPARETGWRTWGVVLLVVAAFLLVAGGVEADVAAFGFGTVAAIAGVACLRSAHRERALRRRHLLATLQGEALRLAGDRGGVLTVSQAAVHLGWTLARAETVLDSMEDGFRVRSEVTSDGRIVYEFRELLPPAGPAAD